MASWQQKGGGTQQVLGMCWDLLLFQPMAESYILGMTDGVCKSAKPLPGAMLEEVRV
jgi:hypothetical protein